MGERMGQGAAVAALAAGQTLIWSALFYTFPAQLPRYEAAFAGQGPAPALGMTAALAAMALASPGAGRWVDRGRAPWMMPAAALLGAAALAALSRAESVWAFLGLWAVIGLAAAGCLYEPCFALLTRARGLSARRAIAAVTLVAGFATAVAYPSVTAMDAAWGWRGATLGQAIVAAALAAPLLAWGAARMEREARAGGAAPGARGRVSLRAALRRPGAARVAAAFAGAALCHGLVTAHMLPLLGAQGVAAGLAATLAALVGPMQVAGRLALLRAPERWRGAALSAGALGAMGLASLSLLGAGAGLGLAGAAMFIALQGAANGAVTILRPATLAEAAGTEDFGAVSGAVALTFAAGLAAAPALGGALRAAGGAEAALVFTACAPLLGAALLGPLMRRG
ncbi:MAG: MFS transporter [Pseudomonadota bacterium]